MLRKYAMWCLTFFSLFEIVFPIEKRYGLGKFEFIALKGKESTNEVSIYFSWRDTDKIISAKHDRREAAGFWR